MSTANRRDILGRLATASAVGALAAPGLEQGATHPDAELLGVWEEWLTTWRDWHAGRMHEDAYAASLSRIETLLINLPARTPEGIAVKLKVAFHELGENLTADSKDFMVRGEPNADMVADYRYRMLWGAVEDLQRVGGRAMS